MTTAESGNTPDKSVADVELVLLPLAAVDVLEFKVVVAVVAVVVAAIAADGARTVECKAAAGLLFSLLLFKISVRIGC